MACKFYCDCYSCLENFHDTCKLNKEERMNNDFCMDFVCIEDECRRIECYDRESDYEPRG